MWDIQAPYNFLEKKGRLNRMKIEMCVMLWIIHNIIKDIVNTLNSRLKAKRVKRQTLSFQINLILNLNKMPQLSYMEVIKREKKI